MPTTPTWTDKARIARAVWTVDLLVQDLPGRARRAVRRDLRTNLYAATADIGSRQALQRLGGLRRIASDYLDAEYGDRRRPRWLSGLAWTLTVEIFLLGLGFAALSAFTAGVLTTDPAADGTFGWAALLPGGIAGDVTLSNGRTAGFSFTISVGMLLYLLGAFVLGSRMWRLWLPPRRPGAN